MDHYLILLGLMLLSAGGFSDTGYCENTMEQIANGFIAKTYMIGTSVKNQCDEGFEGLYADTVNYKCVRYAGKVKWSSLEDCCIKKQIVMNTASYCVRTANNDSLSNEEETTWTDFCGPPPIVPNATLNHSLTDYPLGQELIHSLNGINPTQDGEVLKCMNCSGTFMWVSMTDGCPRSIHRYIITCTAFIIMIMTLVIFGTRHWKEMSVIKSRNQTKSMKSGSEEEIEEHTTVINLNENN
ncbi:uncharacterized protein [Aquarana catesbeiana]|uniref:uncharacterized protein isoform X2 n=1 Tax=Aquarana catesbeiana TaxID=8400 RepID=UPI003CC9C9A1